MRVLMCPPDYFRVRWEINPWMRLSRQPNTALARQQWQAILRRYLELGVEVWFISHHVDLPDMCFTANAGWCRWGRVLLANFRHPERQGERTFFKEWFEEHMAPLSVEVVELPDDIAFEGQGDVVSIDAAETLLVGFGFRTDRRVAEAIRDRYGLANVRPIRLVDPHFYHLDTCCFYIRDSDTLVYYPDAFDRAGRRLISALSCDKIEVTKAEARRFVCNAVFVDSTIIVNHPGRRLTKLLENRGLDVIPVDTSEFLKSGGSVRCLTLFLPEDR